MLTHVKRTNNTHFTLIIILMQIFLLLTVISSVHMELLDLFVWQNYITNSEAPDMVFSTHLPWDTRCQGHLCDVNAACRNLSVTLTTFTAVICSFTQTQTGQNRLLPDPCTFTFCEYFLPLKGHKVLTCCSK